MGLTLSTKKEACLLLYNNILITWPKQCSNFQTIQRDQASFLHLSQWCCKKYLPKESDGNKFSSIQSWPRKNNNLSLMLRINLLQICENQLLKLENLQQVYRWFPNHSIIGTRSGHRWKDWLSLLNTCPLLKFGRFRFTSQDRKLFSS